MPVVPPNPPPGFDDLPVEQKIDYVQALWDRIAADVDQVPLAEWQREVLEQRTEAHRHQPAAARPWREVMATLRERLRTER